MAEKGSRQMSISYSITLFGGDLRHAYMADLLAKKNFQVTIYAVPLYFSSKGCYKASSLSEAVKRSRFLIGPTPLSRDETKITSRESYTDLTIDHLFKDLTPKHKLIAGGLTSNIKKSCDAKGIAYFDFLSDESTARLNAIATAEGAIMEAISNSNGNLHGSRCLILGCGRCGTVLAEKCKALNARVTICARNKDLSTYCAVHGFESAHILALKDIVEGYDYIFNTIPSLVLNYPVLLRVSADTAIIDIASSPGGVDYKAAESLNLNAGNYLGLPGKVAPKSSAKILVDTVLRYIKESGEKKC